MQLSLQKLLSHFSVPFLHVAKQIFTQSRANGSHIRGHQQDRKRRAASGVLEHDDDEALGISSDADDEGNNPGTGEYRPEARFSCLPNRALAEIRSGSAKNLPPYLKNKIRRTSGRFNLISLPPAAAGWPDIQARLGAAKVPVQQKLQQPVWNFKGRKSVMIGVWVVPGARKTL